MLTSPAPGEIHLWALELDLAAADMAGLEAELAEDELRRARAFARAEDRQRFIAARGQLRRILAAYVGEGAAALQFSYNAHGKPSLARGPWQFSLSHSHAHALCAVTTDMPVGVDLELEQLPANFEELAAQIMSPLEKLLFKDLRPAERKEAFLLCWTRKEAFVKALGIGLSAPLQKISVSLADELSPRLLEVADALDSPARWRLCSWRFAPGYVAALAINHVACTCVWQKRWPEMAGGLPPVEFSLL